MNNCGKYACFPKVINEHFGDLDKNLVDNLNTNIISDNKKDNFYSNVEVSDKFSINPKTGLLQEVNMIISVTGDGNHESHHEALSQLDLNNIVLSLIKSVREMRQELNSYIRLHKMEESTMALDTGDLHKISVDYKRVSELEKRQ